MLGRPTAATSESSNVKMISSNRNHLCRKLLKQWATSASSCWNFIANSITLSSSGVSWRNIFMITAITYSQPSRRICQTLCDLSSWKYSDFGNIGCTDPIGWAWALLRLKFKSVTSVLPSTSSTNAFQRLLLVLLIKCQPAAWWPNWVQLMEKSCSVFTQKKIPLERLFVMYIRVLLQEG